MICFTLYHQLYSILCLQTEEKTLAGWTTAQAERPACLQSGGTIGWSQIESSQGCLPWSHQAGLLTSHGDLLVRSTGLNKGSLTSSLSFFLPLTRSSGCFCIWWKKNAFFFLLLFHSFWILQAVQAGRGQRQLPAMPRIQGWTFLNHHKNVLCSPPRLQEHYQVPFYLPHLWATAQAEELLRTTMKTGVDLCSKCAIWTINITKT